jgi:hypothetical protein
VTLTDGPTTVAVDAHFGPNGEIVRVTADRFRDVKGDGVLTPWEVTLGDYARSGEMMIPMTGEVSWLLPAGRFSYWRARIVRVEHE